MYKEYLKRKLVPLQQLLYDMWEGTLYRPRWLPDLRWDKFKAVELLDSVYKSFPIGELVLWCIPDCKEINRQAVYDYCGMYPIDKEVPPARATYILNGYQRLGALCNILGSHVSDTWECCYAPERNMFYPSDKASDISEVISTHDLLTTVRFLRAVDDFSADNREQCHIAVTRLRNYLVPVVTMYCGRCHAQMYFERSN